jgi:HAD superfamily hydrolase (TIGR01509 family)
LFDLDGTLIDSEKLAMDAGMAAFAEIGHPVDLAFMRSLVGVDLPTAGMRIAAEMPLINLVALNQAWDLRFQAGMAAGLRLKPGVRALLDARILPMAVVTSSGRTQALHKLTLTLTLTGIGASFEHVITYDNVSRPKPDPEPYILAAQRLGVTPGDCLVFEYSETGSESAHRAGCYVVQVPDVVPSAGKWAHHLAASILEGARIAGLVI